MNQIKKISEEIKEAVYKQQSEKNDNVVRSYGDKVVELTMKKNKLVAEKLKQENKNNLYDKHYELAKFFIKKLKK